MARAWRAAIVAMCLLPSLSCSPGDGAYDPEEPAVDSPPLPRLENGSFTAELDGVPIHYEVHGQGPILMTVPNSWGLSLEGLRALYRQLEERVTMVYFDPRGMGESGPVREDSDMSMAAVRADFQALRRHLGLDGVHAIGWSNGAMNLVLLAAEQPETLLSAIFLHGAASLTEEDVPMWEERAPGFLKEWGGFLRTMQQESLPAADKTSRMRAFWLEHVFPAMTADPTSAGPMLERLFAEAEFSWPHAEYSERDAPVFDARDQLPAITARSLVLAGAHDMMPPSKGRELHEGLADSRFVVFWSSGHFAPVEEPEAFRQTVFTFLGVD